MIILVIIIILFAWFVLFMKSKIHLFEPFQNLNNLLVNSKHFNNYIRNIHPLMYKVKIKNFNNTNFLKTYIDHLRVPNQNELNILNRHIIKCNKILKKNNLYKLLKLPWLFLVSKRGLEMNMPYTLSNYIVINKSTLENLNAFRQINANFINTLIHEKIHIFQRINQAKFNSFYKRNYTFIVKKINIREVPLQYKKMYMSNPDSNSDFWLYKINNKIYYPILVKNGPFVKSIGINRQGRVDLAFFKKKLGYKSHISFYHPNEIFACEVTDMILDYNIKKPHYKLLNN